MDSGAWYRLWQKRPWLHTYRARFPYGDVMMWTISCLALLLFQPMDLPERTLLALGDSYTIGEGVSIEERWPEQLVSQLKERSGQWSRPQIIAKTGWTTDELQAGIASTELRDRYDWVTLLIGVNNQYRGRDLSEYRTQFRELLTYSIEKAGGNAKRVIVLSIPDWGVTPFALQRGRDPALIGQQIDAFNAVNREETAAAGAHYIDITARTREVADQPARYLVADQLHPSGEMYREWANRAAAVVLADASTSRDLPSAPINKLISRCPEATWIYPPHRRDVHGPFRYWHQSRVRGRVRSLWQRTP